MGLYTPTILGGNSYLSWFYDRGPVKDRAHTGTSKGLSQVINSGPKCQPKYANLYVTIQSHGLSARTHYVTVNGVRGEQTKQEGGGYVKFHPYEKGRGEFSAMPKGGRGGKTSFGGVFML